MVSKKEKRKKRKSVKKIREGNREDQQACEPGSQDCGDVSSIPRVGYHGDKAVDTCRVSNNIDQCDSTRGSDKSISNAPGTLIADTPDDAPAPEGSKRGKKRKRKDSSWQREPQDEVNSHKSHGCGDSPKSRRKLKAQERPGKASGSAVLTGNNSIPRAGSSSAQADVHDEAPTPRLSELQQRMRHKLEGAQFRMINETLYTSESKAAVAKFQAHPELFDVVSFIDFKLGPVVPAYQVDISAGELPYYYGVLMLHRFGVEPRIPPTMS